MVGRDFRMDGHHRQLVEHLLELAIVILDVLHKGRV